MRGTLYGVGVGPGDPELLTRKAERIIRTAVVVAVPDPKTGQTARTIAGDLLEGKTILPCPIPMVRDRAVVDAAYDQAAEAVCKFLEEGKDVAFLTLGDPTIYSTYLPLHQRVTERGFSAEIVPGVPSFCAAAAALGQGLCKGEERLLIAPATRSVEDCWNLDANLVLLKAGRHLPELRETLAQRERLERAALVVNCGMEGEQLCPDLTEDPGAVGYFSLLIVPQE